MYEDERDFANELADRADAISMDLFTHGGFEVRRKPDSTPVTEGDLRIEAMIRAALAERFPEDAILGEEEGASGDADRVWIIDPIDGTKNFTDAIPIWGTLICLQDKGVGVVGVASAPALAERWDAAAGLGARCNGAPITVSSVDTLDDAFLTYGDIERWEASSDLQTFLQLAADVRRTRGLGDFWAHLMVARGSADVCVERELRIWDWGAVDVIVREAGGTMTTLDGEPPSDHGTVLSTNGPLHDAVLARFSAQSDG